MEWTVLPGSKIWKVFRCLRYQKRFLSSPGICLSFPYRASGFHTRFKINLTCVFYMRKKKLFPYATTEFEEQLVSKKPLCCAGHHKLRWSESSRSCADILESPPILIRSNSFLLYFWLHLSTPYTHAWSGTDPLPRNSIPFQPAAYRAYITELISLVTVPWELYWRVFYFYLHPLIIDCTNEQQQR